MNNELIKLRRFITNHFSLDELRTLCFDLGIDYEELEGKSRSAKVRELLLWAGRNRKFEELLHALHHDRKELFVQANFSTKPAFLEQLYTHLPSLESRVPSPTSSSPASAPGSKEKRLFDGRQSKIWMAIMGLIGIVLAAWLIVPGLLPTATPPATTPPVVATATAAPTTVTLPAAAATDAAAEFLNMVMDSVEDDIEKRTAEGYEAAISVFEDAIQQRPELARLHYELGRARYNLATKQNDDEARTAVYNQAIAALNAAMERDASYIEALVLRGRAFINIKDYLKAVEDFENLLELGHEPVNIQILLGQAYIGANKNDEAIALFSALLELEPAGVLYCWRGAAYSKNRDFNEAEADFDEADRLGVESSEVCSPEEERQLLQERRSS